MRFIGRRGARKMATEREGVEKERKRERERERFLLIYVDGDTVTGKGVR